MALFKISKGLKANLPATKTAGYCWYTTDDSLFYIDYEDESGVVQRKALNAKEAEKLAGASLATILNSTDLEIPTSKAVLTALAGKANATHSHDDKYYTESEIDTKLASKSDTTHKHDGVYDTKGSAAAVQQNVDTVSDELDAHTGNADIHVTAAKKTNWDVAYTHSQAAHARVDATKVADSTTNGNILINGTETNVYSHPNSGVTAGTYKSITVNAQGHVTAGSNPTTLSGYGITDAETKSDASAKLTAAKAYADEVAGAVKNDLLNGAGAAYDTLKELGELIDDNKDAIDALEDIAAGKADKEHGTHVTYSTTAPVMDGTASVGSATTVARSDHKHPTDTTRAAKADLDSHTGNTTVHITSTERTNWNAAKTHADSAHAPSNAEKNQNAFSNILVGSTTIAADTATDTLTLVGTNVTITPDATNDKVTFAVADGTTSAKGVVQLTNSTSSTSTTTAATPSSVKAAYDLANTANTAASTVQTNLNSEIARAKAAEAQIVQSDWSVADTSKMAFIKNKPVYTSDINLSWNGSTSGKTYVTVDGNKYCKVSDEVLMACYFTSINATIGIVDTMWNSTFEDVVKQTNVYDINGILVIDDGYTFNVVSVPSANMTLVIGYTAVTFPEAGTYFIYVPESFYVYSLKVTGLAGKITAKNLPQGITSKGEFEKHVTDSTWTKIYDSGAVTSKVNAFMNIDVTGYKKLKVAIKCVNTTDSYGTTAGEISFKAISEVNYYFSNLFPNLISKSTNISSAMVEFTIVDGFIFCDNVLRSTTTVDMLSNFEGQGTWNMTNLGGGIMTCSDPLITMNVTTLNSATQYYYGTNSRVIVWGCKA